MSTPGFKRVATCVILKIIQVFLTGLLFRLQGSTYVPAKLPEKPLVLWAYEVCYFYPSRLVTFYEYLSYPVFSEHQLTVS